MKPFGVLLWFFLSPFILKAQSTMLDDKEIQLCIIQGMEKMYNLEFEEAEKYFVQIKQKYPNHPAYDMVRSMSLTWDMMYNNSFKKRSEEGLKYIDNSLKQAAILLEKNPNDPEGVFFTLAGRSSLALYYAQTNQTIKSVNEARKAYYLIKKADELKDKLTDFYFPVGLYNYYVVQYPENHPVFKPFMFFFMKGDKKLGLKQLEYSGKHGVFSKTECTYYLGHIYLRYEENPHLAEIYTAPLIKKYPENIYFKINHCEALIGAKKYKEAEIIAYELYKKDKIFSKIAASTYYGHLNERYFDRPEKAKIFYQQAIDLSKTCEFPTHDFIGQCYAGLGRYYHSIGDTKNAIDSYKKCQEITDYLSLMKESEVYLAKYD